MFLKLKKIIEILKENKHLFNEISKTTILLNKITNLL